MVYFLVLILMATMPKESKPKEGPESRALAYLIREVPRWKTDNHCFSCHNNGNGARVLYQAQLHGYHVGPEALRETTSWLKKPSEWIQPDQDDTIYDKKLARIQFASTLLKAKQNGAISAMEPLRQVADELAQTQNKNGSWSTSSKETIGSPTTLGTPLSTMMVRNLLFNTDAKRYAREITQSDTWFRKLQIQSVVDACSVLLALQQSDDESAKEQRQKSIELIQIAERKGGGWGPYRNASPEVFDTALVMLALMSQQITPELEQFLQRGRAFLIRQQLEDGSWPETTRPKESISYAQRIATTSWALEALLAVRTK